jgi:hypothetical protein
MDLRGELATVAAWYATRRSDSVRAR